MSQVSGEWTVGKSSEGRAAHMGSPAGHASAGFQMWACQINLHATDKQWCLHPCRRRNEEDISIHNTEEEEKHPESEHVRFDIPEKLQEDFITCLWSNKLSLTLKHSSVTKSLAMEQRETASGWFVCRAFAASRTRRRDATNLVAISASLNWRY